MTTTKRIVQIITFDETGDCYYRMRWPGQEAAQKRKEWCVLNVDSEHQARYQLALEADLLVLIQPGDLDLLKIIAQRKLHGRPTLVEFNDNFYAPPPWSPVAKEWDSPLLQQGYEFFLKAADHLMVTGQGLFELFSTQVNREKISIIENQVPELPPARSAERTVTKIGWAGSLGHIADLISCAPLIRELISSEPNLTMQAMGNDSIPRLLSLPPDRLLFKNWGSIFDYYAALQSFDLGLIPLLDTPYNRCRSDIKAVELIACGALPLIPNALPYRAFLAATKLPSYNSYNELKELVKSYLHSPEKFKGDLEGAASYVREQRVTANRHERVELYEKLLNQVKSPAPQWIGPTTPGHFELRSNEKTKSTSTPAFRALAKAQELLKQKRGKEATEILIVETRENPTHPDLKLALLKIQAAEDAMKTLSSARLSFPRDLRFEFIALARALPQPPGSDSWRTILTTLKKHENVRKTFAREAITLYLRQLQESKVGLELGYEFLALAPEVLALPLALAERELYSNRFEKARLLLEPLVRELRKRVIDGTMSAKDIAYAEGLLAGVQGAREKGNSSPTL